MRFCFVNRNALLFVTIEVKLAFKQAAADKGKQLGTSADEEETSSAKISNEGSAAAESLVSKMNELVVSSKSVTSSSQSVDVESSDVGAQGQDIDKKIRALKKKVSVTFSHIKTLICFLE